LNDRELWVKQFYTVAVHFSWTTFWFK